MRHNPGIGGTDELSLRVSVATLVRVVYTTNDNKTMLALEQKGTFLEREQDVMVIAQPFGGAVRIHDLTRIHAITGGFHFDSERSRAEQDFRIFIRPSAWEEVKAYCLDQFQASKEAAFETSPERELEEELHDSLGIQVHPDQYICRPLWIALEDQPTFTRNIHAERQPTVRLYGIFEAQITEPSLWREICLNSRNSPTRELQQRVLEDRHNGGKGRANACIVFPMEALRRYYLSLSPEQRNERSFFEETKLEENIPALLKDVDSSRFQLIQMG